MRETERICGTTTTVPASQIKCTPASTLPANVSGGIGGNVLLGRCTGPYGDPLEQTIRLASSEGFYSFKTGQPQRSVQALEAVARLVWLVVHISTTAVLGSGTVRRPHLRVALPPPTLTHSPFGAGHLSSSLCDWQLDYR